MRMTVCCLVALLYTFRSNGQAKTDDFNTLFAFEVHTIDDFFDRFNFKINTAFDNFVNKNYPGSDLSRTQLIHSLFNYKNADFIRSDQEAFLVQVTDTACPEFAYYKDADWYAELHCQVYYRKKPKKLTLILKVEQSKHRYFRWSIVSARADFLTINHTRYDSLRYIWEPPYQKTDSSFSPKYFLSPVCHALDFMDLDNVFIHKDHVIDYIYNGPESPALLKLIDQIKSSEINFVQVNSVKYHLLQVDGWIVAVEYFLRDEKNSGWLINKLIRATDEEKENYLVTSLNIPTMPVRSQE